MSVDFDMASMRDVFFEEARQLLDDIEYIVLGLEVKPSDQEMLNALFRAVHTIKGSAGVFGFMEISNFIHDLETVLDRVRKKELSFDDDLGTLTLRSADQVRALVMAIEANQSLSPLPDDLANAQAAISCEIRKYLEPSSGTRTDNTKPDEQAVQSGPSVQYALNLALREDTLCDGFDPAALFAYLEKMGSFKWVQADVSKMPAWTDYNPEKGWLAWNTIFETNSSQGSMALACEYMAASADLTCQPVAKRVGEERVQAQAQAPAEAPAQPATNTKPGVSSVRVPSDKLDALINLVGELVIANASTLEQTRQMGNSTLLESVRAVGSLIEEIRDGALGLRMIEIGDCFQRFRRVVRDLSKTLGKEVELELLGEDTELDKSVVEKISDPLLHLVRNALDHGLESEQERIDNGKPGPARLTLSAHHDGGHIVIEVRDNGRGLNKRQILNKAIEKGIVDAGQVLSDEQIHELIFAPGFSTAQQVTDVSGRGVGMDVVKRNIEALRGSVLVHSEEGVGTQFQIQLPLTLAIIDGFQVKVGDSVYVIPLTYVQECVELSAESKRNTGTELHCDLRGEFLPCVRLGGFLGTGRTSSRRENVIVVNHAGRRVGIVADELIGESQTVIKPLGELFTHNDLVSGGTILGDGKVALILDVPNIITAIGRRNRQDQEQPALGV